MSLRHTDLPLTWHTDCQGMDWHALRDLFDAAPLGRKQPEGLAIAFQNSRYVRFVRDEHGTLVAAGRVLADGFDCAYLCDIAVHPRLQGTGLGQAVVQQLLDEARHHQKIILYAVAGKEPFYKRFGFRRMLTAMAIFQDPQAAVARGQVEGD